MKEIIILIGYSGTGKTTTLKNLSKEYAIVPIITTRKERRDEKNTYKEYIFVTKNYFKTLIKKNMFITYKKFWSNNEYYGILKTYLDEILEKNNKIVIILNSYFLNDFFDYLEQTPYKNDIKISIIFFKRLPFFKFIKNYINRTSDFNIKKILNGILRYISDIFQYYNNNALKLLKKRIKAINKKKEKIL